MLWLKIQSLVHSIAFQLILLLITLLFSLPLLWMLLASLQPNGVRLYGALPSLGNGVAWGNYARLFELLPLGRYIFNSLLVTLIAVPTTIVVASWAGFAMAQLPARERYVLLGVAVILRMVPITALWLTRFVLFTRLGIIDTIWPLVAPAWMGTSPFFVLLFYWSFRRMPQSFFDAARLDGMGAFGMWLRIGMPLAFPATMTVGVLSFVHYWSDFINPLLYLKSEERYTLAVGLRIVQQMDLTNWPLLMAAAVMMTLPVVLLFIAAQRVFWRSV